MMMRHMAIKLFVNLFIGLVMLLSMASVHADWQQPELSYNLTPVAKPIKAPTFDLMNMDDEKVSLDDFKGKVVMVNFWATWCPPCIREMPSLERLHNKIDGDQFKVVAINQMENVDNVFAFTGQLEVDPTFDILFDQDSSISLKYSVRGLPTTYLIDKQGYIRYRAVGGRIFDHDEVVAIINRLIEE
jgi:thiol-disulfide isomerase/thioredoxin